MTTQAAQTPKAAMGVIREREVARKAKKVVKEVTKIA